MQNLSIKFLKLKNDKKFYWTDLIPEWIDFPRQEDHWPRTRRNDRIC